MNPLQPGFQMYSAGNQALESRVAQLEAVVNADRGSQFKLWKWFFMCWRQTCRLTARESLAAAGRTPRMPLEFRSQLGEDVLLFQLLDGQLDGVFVEVGAFDGFSLAVSYAFDAMGWEGLLIEPVPPNFELCRRNRPFAHVVNAALSRPGAEGTATMLHVKDEYGDQGGALSHLEAMTGREEVAGARKFGHVKYEVPVRTMDSVLEEAQGWLNGRRIDFVCIDVEGHESELIEGFNVGRWRPRVVVIEDNLRGKNPAVQRQMEAHGYKRVFMLEIDVFYVHERDEALLKRARELF